MVYFKENYTFLRFQNGSNIFQESNFPGVGVQMLISIETYISCDFPGGGFLSTHSTNPVNMQSRAIIGLPAKHHSKVFRWWTVGGQASRL